MKAIPFSVGYFADEQGNIYSTRPYKRSVEFRITPIKLTSQIQRNGYHTVKIIFKGQRKMMSVGYLVLLTFISDRPSKNHQVCHGIKGKSFNGLDNVSWKTGSQNNTEDKKRDGKFNIGEKHHRAKLKNEDITRIKHLHNKGKGNQEIANIFNVHHSNISKIILGHSRVY